MKINLRGPCNCLLGYGHACFNIIKHLQLNNEVSYFNIGEPYLTTDDVNIIKQTLCGQENFDINAPSLTIWHEHSLAERIGKGPHTALSFFEINSLNDRRKHHLGQLDCFFSPSKWAQKIVDEKVGCKTVLCPMGVDRSIFNESVPALKHDLIDPNAYKFLCLGKIEIRKGHDFLVEIFNNAFNQTDNVQLIMSWNTPFLTDKEQEEWINLYKNSRLGDKILFVSHMPNDIQLASLINTCQCFILPTRAEGWNFPLLQALSCGRQVITTDYSAHTEFCNTKNSHLIHISELEQAFDGKWFNGLGQWAKIGKPEKEQAIRLMRKVYQHGPRLNTEGIETAKQFSWQKCVDIITNTLGEFK